MRGKAWAGLPQHVSSDVVWCVVVWCGVQLDALWPAIALFIGFVAYFVLTIGLTQWRKRIRMDMNRKVQRRLRAIASLGV
jgi:hypothetical protein